MRNRYNFQEMKVGDSKFFDDTEQRALSSSSSLHTKYHNNGRKYRTETVPNGAKIWRTQ